MTRYNTIGNPVPIKILLNFKNYYDTYGNLFMGFLLFLKPIMSVIKERFALSLCPKVVRLRVNYVGKTK